MTRPLPIATYEGAARSIPPLVEFAIYDARRVKSTWRNLLREIPSASIRVEDVVNRPNCTELERVYDLLCRWKVYSLCIVEKWSWLRLTPPPVPMGELDSSTRERDSRTILLPPPNQSLGETAEDFLKECPIGSIREFLLVFAGAQLSLHPEGQEYFLAPAPSSGIEVPCAQIRTCDSWFDDEPGAALSPAQCLSVACCPHGFLSVTTSGRLFLTPTMRRWNPIEIASGWTGFIERFLGFLDPSDCWMVPSFARRLFPD